MNGFSLLIAFAVVGITAQTETSSNGQPVYTIRIEPILVDELRAGREINTNVGLKDRSFRRFRILVTPENAGRNPGIPARSENNVRSESLVEYEPVLTENNEVEMWVQLAPERIETLASGRAIEGEVPADVPEIQRFRIFVGMNELPRQQQPATQPRDSQAPYLLAADNGLAPAAAEVRTPSNSTTRTPNTPFQPSTNATTTSGSRQAPAITPSRSNYPWRNGPDQTTVAPPPVDRYGTSQPTAAPAYANDPRFGAPPAGRLDEQYAPATNYQANNPAYTYGTTGSPQTQLYPQGQIPPGYSQPQATLAARPENTGTLQPQVPTSTTWGQTPAQPLVAAPQTVAPQVQAPLLAANTATAPTTTAKADEPAKRATSTPLILTTLGLFTSLGVNAYLGWLAWSFFWRYRDAVNDSARARSYNAASRQAA